MIFRNLLIMQKTMIYILFWKCAIEITFIIHLAAKVLEIEDQCKLVICEEIAAKYSYQGLDSISSKGMAYGSKFEFR